MSKGNICTPARRLPGGPGTGSMLKLIQQIQQRPSKSFGEF